jgi:hypothetical protein
VNAPSSNSRPALDDPWPALPLSQWEPTRATLHMWTQIVGKIRTRLAPPLNHYWHSPLYVTASGLTTSAIPYGTRAFEIEFDFLEHLLAIRRNDGAVEIVKLQPRSVADFYRELMAKLGELGVTVKIWTMPQEVPEPIPFDRDEQHASYDPAAATRFWRVLLSCSHTFEKLRCGFVGKQSPVHFFWGSFDLAVTRFSGRRAPERPGADPITREAYSHEVASVGWWPGSGDIQDAAFYAYAAPQPEGFDKANIGPPAFYQSAMSEYILMYEDARQAADPDAAIRQFAESCYTAAASLGKWDPSLARSAPSIP